MLWCDRNGSAPLAEGNCCEESMMPFGPSVNLTALARMPSSVGGEAVQQAGAAGGHQVGLAATAAWMRRIPGRVAAAGAVEVAQLRGTVGGAAGVVLARMAGSVGIGTAIRLRAGDDVMLVRLVARALHRLVLFGEDGGARQVVAETGGVQRIAMQVRHVARDHGAARVEPGPVADAVARIDSRLAVGSLRSQIRAPGLLAGADRFGQLLTVRIGAGQAAEVRAFAQAFAGDEETQWLGRIGGTRGVRLRRSRRLRQRGMGQAQRRDGAAHQGCFMSGHVQSLDLKSSWQDLQVRCSLPNWALIAATSPPPATVASSLASLPKLALSSAKCLPSLNTSGLALVSCQPLPCSVPAANKPPRPELAMAAMVLAARCTSSLMYWPSTEALMRPAFQATTWNTDWRHLIRFRLRRLLREHAGGTGEEGD